LEKLSLEGSWEGSLEASYVAVDILALTKHTSVLGPEEEPMLEPAGALLLVAVGATFVCPESA
jgi:hypothetical protein